MCYFSSIFFVFVDLFFRLLLETVDNPSASEQTFGDVLFGKPALVRVSLLCAAVGTRRNSLLSRSRSFPSIIGKPAVPFPGVL